MTTLWADGFDSNGATDLTYDYAFENAYSFNFVAGRRTGSYAIARVSSNGAGLLRSLGVAPSTVFASIAVKMNSLWSYSGPFLRFMEGTISHICLSINSTGQIEVRRGSYDGTVIGTTAIVAPVGTWYWLQVKVVIHDTTGSVEIRDASGTVILNLTGQDTRNGGTSGVCDTIGIGPCDHYGGHEIYMDDLHVWDSTGSICNTFTNDTRIDDLVPSGAGSVTQFTPSAGANWDCVNEEPTSTTDYVSDATAGHQDLYAFTDLPHVPLNIYGVVVGAVACKDDSGARSIKTLAKSSATLNTGSAQTLTLGSWVRLCRTVEADPNTSAAWTPTNLNGATFGIENV